MANGMTPRDDEDGRDRNVAAGIVAGLIGGLAATWAMSEFQGLWSKSVDGREPASAAGPHDARDRQERNEDQNANERAAQAIADVTIQRELTPDGLRYGAAGVHYLFGGVMGALYGGLCETSPAVRALGGVGWGTAVWIGGDKIAVPLLGLPQGADPLPFEANAQAFAAHVVYGATVEIVRRGVRALLSQ